MRPEPSSSQWRVIAKHAGTVWVGQLAVMAYGVIDTMVAARHSEVALAALGVGSAVFISVYVSLMGIMHAMLPIYAEHRGAGQQAEVGKAFRQALYLGGMVSVVGITLLLHPKVLMQAAAVPEHLQHEVSSYLSVLALAFAPALLFRMFAALSQALGQAKVVTGLQLLSIVLKWPLTLWLCLGWQHPVFGEFAGLGVQGCAWATFAVNTSLALCAFVLLAKQAHYRAYAVWRRLERPDWRRIGGFARLGIPVGLSTLVEITSFTLMALFIARLGNTASAAHQVAASMAALLFMAPLSIGVAGSARTSYWLGAQRPDLARQAALQSLTMGLLLACLLSAVLAAFAPVVAQAYVPASAVTPIATQWMAAHLLVWVAAYHVVDAGQGTCAFVLRSYKVAMRPFLVYVVGLWGLGLAGGYVLCFVDVQLDWLDAGYALPAMQQPQAFWFAAVVSTAIVALCFVWMLWRVSAERLQPLRTDMKLS